MVRGRQGADRGGDAPAGHAKALLGGYGGIVQCDAYGAYKTLAAADGGITLAFCWSHVRREFIELAKGKTAPIATETLQRIAACQSAPKKDPLSASKSDPLSSALRLTVWPGAEP